MRNINGVNVCVVGGAGFLGSHLVNYLIEERHCQVFVLDNLVTGRLSFLHQECTFEHCDITGSETQLHRLFEHWDIQYVFNYAAEPYIPLSFERPVHVFNVNAFGALKVINAAQESGCLGILQVSSAEIYGDQLGLIDEDAPVTPHSSYGASKAAIDSLVQARWKETKTPCIALRQFNCLGERETHPYVITEIISQLSQGPTIKLGNNSHRDFQYAGDAVRMAVSLLEYGQFGEVYNMGSEQAISIYDLAEQVGNLMNVDHVSIQEDVTRKRPWEIWHLQSNNDKLYRAIPERPQVGLTLALQKTIDYFYAVEGNWGW